LRHLKLNWRSRLLLGNQCPAPNHAAGQQVTDPELNQVAASQLAIHREVEQREITHAALALEVDSDRSNLPRFECELRPD
jgi:hypothetical protein